MDVQQLTINTINHVSLMERIGMFMAGVNKMREDKNKEKNWNYHEPCVIRNGRVTGDWLAIDEINGGSRSVYCFIRLTDGENRTYGLMKAGQIFMAASFKKPAKHARGSVYDADVGLSCASLYGINYLR